MSENPPNISSSDQNANNNINPTFVGINGEITGLGFATRDHGAKNEEDLGILEFVTIKNDRTHENMRLLIDLKNIFSRQLPKMPKEYISKLVFDRNHESLVILKNKNKIIGGICYRKYPTQHFAEIAFLAVTATEQVKGYGTRLMNKYKDKMQAENIEFLLTYADNYAIGYFKKQGFSKEHKMPAERWKGFIKDYDGGTFMECLIHASIDYCNISNIIKEQKMFIIEQVKNLCINDKKFPGLDFTNCDKEKKNETNTLLKIEEINGILASGWVF